MTASYAGSAENFVKHNRHHHYSDAIIGVMASQITSLTIVYSTVYSGADQRKHQSSASLAYVRGIHRWPVNSPHKGPVFIRWRHHDTSSIYHTTLNIHGTHVESSHFMNDTHSTRANPTWNKSAQGRQLWSSLVCKSMCTRRKCWKLSPITLNITFSKRVTVV